MNVGKGPWSGLGRALRTGKARLHHQTATREGIMRRMEGGMEEHHQRDKTDKRVRRTPLPVGITSSAERQDIVIARQMDLMDLSGDRDQKSRGEILD
jgi:hypothetical protein